MFQSHETKEWPHSHIAEMKAHSHHRDAPDKAEADHQRELAAFEICEEIRAAFKGVTLEGGIGLWQAQGIDDHEDDLTCAEYRQRDEKEHWENISADALNACYSSLGFFDAEGMRFNLPAFLIADLNGEYLMDMESRLVNIGSLEQGWFSLLNQGQRLAVGKYLTHISDGPDCSVSRVSIKHALDTYWTNPP